jgi:hypothetical protein
MTGFTAAQARAYDEWKTEPRIDTRAVCDCMECGETIYEGDICREIDGRLVCESCVRDTSGDIILEKWFEIKAQSAERSYKHEDDA